MGERKWTAMAGVVEEIVRGVRARGKEVAVLYIPSKWQHDPSSHKTTNSMELAGVIVRKSWLSGELEIDRRLEELANRAQVPLLNLTAGLREEVAKGGVLKWQHDDPLTAAGNRYVAKTLAEWIKGDRVFGGLE